jgi:hypothetical protein
MTTNYNGWAHAGNRTTHNEVVETQDEFNKEVLKEWNVAWSKDKKEIIQRLSVGGNRPSFAIMKVLEQTHKLGFYNGVAMKVEFVENNG